MLARAVLSGRAGREERLRFGKLAFGARRAHSTPEAEYQAGLRRTRPRCLSAEPKLCSVGAWYVICCTDSMLPPRNAAADVCGALRHARLVRARGAEQPRHCLRGTALGTIQPAAEAPVAMAPRARRRPRRRCWPRAAWRSWSASCSASCTGTAAHCGCWPPSTMRRSCCCRRGAPPAPAPSPVETWPVVLHGELVLHGEVVNVCCASKAWLPVRRHAPPERSFTAPVTTTAPYRFGCLCITEPHLTPPF